MPDRHPIATTENHCTNKTGNNMNDGKIKSSIEDFFQLYLLGAGLRKTVPHGKNKIASRSQNPKNNKYERITFLIDEQDKSSTLTCSFQYELLVVFVTILFGTKSFINMLLNFYQFPTSCYKIAASKLFSINNLILLKGVIIK